MGSNKEGIAQKFIVNLLRFQGEMGLSMIDYALREEISVAYKGGYGYKLTKSHLRKIEELGYIRSRAIPVPERKSRETDGVEPLYYARKPDSRWFGVYALNLPKVGKLPAFPPQWYLEDHYFNESELAEMSSSDIRKEGLKLFDEAAESNGITWNECKSIAEKFDLRGPEYSDEKITYAFYKKKFLKEMDTLKENRKHKIKKVEKRRDAIRESLKTNQEIS
jgi:hypothetical protein